MKKIFGVLSLAVIALALSVPTARPAAAAEFIAGDHNGNVTLSAGETHHNVYTAGSTVFVNSNVSGDLFAAGSSVTIESNIEQDVAVGAGTVTINGEINGDLRIGAGTVTINNRVGGDILIGSGTVVLTEKASVGGDLVAGGGVITVNGPVAGDVKIGGSDITLNSEINGEVKVQSDRSLTIGSNAVIAQPIAYKGVKDATVQDGAQISGVDFEKIVKHHNNHASRFFASIFTLMFVIKVVGLILAGLLLLKLFPRTSRAAVDYMQRGMWMNLLVGFVALIVAPIAFIILLVTFVGMYIAFAVVLVWLLMLLLSALVALAFVGAWLIKLVMTARTEMVYDWQAIVIGAVAVALLTLIPFIGGIIFFALLLMAFGGLVRQLYSQIRSEQSSTPATPQNPLI